MIKPLISFADFLKLDFRVGKVLEAVVIEESNKLIRLLVDLGEDYGKKTILAGIKENYKPEDLQGKKFVFLANLEPKKMIGEESQGMIMAADAEGRAVIINIDDSVPTGTIIR